jgi:hypothetical protein
MDFLNQKFQDAYNEYISAQSQFNELNANDIQMDTAIHRLNYATTFLDKTRKELMV